MSDGTEYISYGGIEWLTEFYGQVVPRPWLKDAECRGFDPNLWYPTTSGRKPDSLAVQICRECPVRLECLQHALDVDDRYGIHGGVGEYPRRRWAAEGLTAAEMIERADA